MINQFIANIKKVKESRHHKVINSYGVYDYFKYYRKNKPNESKYVLTESQYFAIFRHVNMLLAEELLAGKDVSLPKRLGKLELRKKNIVVKIDDGKLITNMGVDWDSTLRLWHEDPEAFQNKTLIKIEDKERVFIKYNKATALFQNKSFYSFKANRQLLNNIRQLFKNGHIDAFSIY